MYEEVKGDLFETDLEWIAHGCNAKGVMGSGVAKVVRERYPQAYKDYMDMVLHVEPGDVIVSAPILNLITQRDYGRDPNRQYAKVEWIVSALEQSHQIIPPQDSIAMPMIGAGLGGLRWSEVRPVLEEFATTCRRHIRVYYL